MVHNYNFRSYFWLQRHLAEAIENWPGDDVWLKVLQIERSQLVANVNVQGTELIIDDSKQASDSNVYGHCYSNLIFLSIWNVIVMCYFHMSLLCHMPFLCNVSLLCQCHISLFYHCYVIIKYQCYDIVMSVPLVCQGICYICHGSVVISIHCQCHGNVIVSTWCQIRSVPDHFSSIQWFTYQASAVT